MLCLGSLTNLSHPRRCLQLRCNVGGDIGRGNVPRDGFSHRSKVRRLVVPEGVGGATAAREESLEGLAHRLGDVVL